MHPCFGENVHAFVAAAAKAFGLRGPVYHFESCRDGRMEEVGPLHHCFPRTEYVVCRFNEGIQLGRLPFPDGSAQTVLWIGAAGHVLNTHEAVAEMRRILAPGGALLICAPTDGPAHEGAADPSDSATCRLQRLLGPLPLTLLAWQGANSWPHTVYGVGFQPPITAATLRGTSQFLDRFAERSQQGGGKIGWWKLLKKGVRTVFSLPRRRTSPKTEAEDNADPFSGVQFAVHMSADRAAHDNLLKAWLLGGKTGGRRDLTD